MKPHLSLVSIICICLVLFKSIGLCQLVSRQHLFRAEKMASYAKANMKIEDIAQKMGEVWSKVVKQKMDSFARDL